jgi:hypothetical protein
MRLFMPGRLNRKVAIVTTSILVALAGAAFVYWSTGGSRPPAADTGTANDVTVNQPRLPTGLYPNGVGTSTGNAGTLTPPGGVTATATAGSATVAVSWAGVVGTDGGPVDGYYVQRYSGATPSPACLSSPTALLLPSRRSCSDASVADGTYTYSVTAVFHSLTAESTRTAAVTVQALTHFAVTAPASATAGTAFTVTVTAKDTSDNTIVGYVGTVHFATSDLAAPVVPADYTFVTGDEGTHTFTNGVILNTSPTQSITVNDTSDTTKTGTASVVVAPGPAAQLGFTRQPEGGTGGVAWTTQPKVAIQDALGNTVTTSTASVTLTITPGTGTPGAVLTCTTNPKAAVSGIVTFTGCKIDKPGIAYTLTATAAGLTDATSNTFDVALGPAVKVAFTQQPTTVVAGSLISPAVVVTVQDAGGNTVTSSNATVTLAIGTNPGGGTLSGTVSKPASSGVATFADLSINKTGNGYKLVASSAGLTSATSSTFNVTAGAAAQLGFIRQPEGGTGGVAWTTQPKVAIQDALGNTVTTSTASVTLTITTGTGTPGAVLTCTTNPKAAVSGIVTFTGCKIDKPGIAYTLTATAAGLTDATSNTFDIS